MRTLNVACYYPWVYLRSGIERIMLEVCRRSRHRWTIYTNHFAPNDTYPEFSSLEVVELPPISVNRGYFQVARGTLRLLWQKLPMKKHDLLLVQSEGLGDFITFQNHAKPVVCYCHTPLKVLNDPWARDQYLRRNPTRAPFLRVFGAIFQYMDRLAWRNYSYVLTNSETVRDRIVRARLAKKEKIQILYPGVDCAAMTPSGQYKRYFLLLARLKWWKNVELAIEGFKEFQRLCPTASEFKLVIAGQVDEGSRKYFRELFDLAQPCEEIKFVPNPSGEQVQSLYSSCYAVLNTTLNEDWGIVPLEANAYAKPVIAVNQGGPRESQVDGKTGYLVDPTPEAFARAMGRLAQNEQLVRKMGRTARQNVLRYDWSPFVSRLDQVLEDIVGEP